VVHDIVKIFTSISRYFIQYRIKIRRRNHMVTYPQISDFTHVNQLPKGSFHAKSTKMWKSSHLTISEIDEFWW